MLPPIGADYRECTEPLPPVMNGYSTRIYGAPRGRPGRNGIPVLAIAIHCVQDTFNGFLLKACTANPKLSPHGNASFHYVVDAESLQVASLVHENDLAWAFQSYLSNFPVTQPILPPPCPPNECEPAPCPPVPPIIITAEEAYPGWPELAAIYPNLSADFYTINIGITTPSRPENDILDGEDCCIGPYGMTQQAYQNLVRLVAWVAYRREIPVIRERIAFHDDIVPTLMGCEECKCDSRGTCFICDVSSYCSGCLSPSDPSFRLSDNIRFIYGESASGCKVKIRLDFLRSLING